ALLNKVQWGRTISGVWCPPDANESEMQICRGSARGFDQVLTTHTRAAALKAPLAAFRGFARAMWWRHKEISRGETYERFGADRAQFFSGAAQMCVDRREP